MESTKKTHDAFKITGNWADQSKVLKQKFAHLTDEDLKFIPGKENDLLKRVETRLKKDRQEVINIIQKGAPKSATKAL